MFNPWKDVTPRYIDRACWLKSELGYPSEISGGEYQPGGWVSTIPSMIISNFSNSGELVLDQFVGGGTTLFEAIILNRKAIGCDINSAATYMSREIVKLTLENDGIYIRKKDARRLYGIDDESIDLICTQPPIFNGSRNCNSPKGDMSIMGLDEYIISLGKVAAESRRVLKKGRYCAIMTGDIRMKNCVIPLSVSTANAFNNAGFSLKDIIINQKQNQVHLLNTYSPCSVTREYLMVFIKL